MGRVNVFMIGRFFRRGRVHGVISSIGRVCPLMSLMWHIGPRGSEWRN
jgi:hypothetical protein